MGRALAGGLALAAAACDPQPFDYARRTPPRIFVWHEPLHPRPGESVTLRARAELAPGSAGRIQITFISAFSRSRSAACDGSECALGPFAIPATTPPQLAVYGASLTVGSRTFSAGGPFGFHIGEPAGVTRLILRAPVRDEVAYKVVLVRDRDSFTTDAPVWAAAQRALYESILADPVYRWRDNAIGFYYLRTPGVTRDYYSGLSSRCGQDPWAGMAVVPDPGDADSLAVVHNRADYRDCSGLGVTLSGSSPRRNFHVYAGNPQAWKHELGHAAFGLSDEYTESTETRRAAPRTPPVPPPECNCCPPGSVDGECRGRPVCRGDLPPECFPASPACPPLGSACVFPNVFASQNECRAAAVAIEAHPGVESPADPDACRLLCRGDCPCGAPAEVWVLDAQADVMAGGPGHHGPACARCTEASLCVLWETRRTGSLAAARRHCGVP